MTDIKAWIDERRAIHAAATEGPWELEGEVATETSYRPARIYVEGWTGYPVNDACEIAVPQTNEDVRAVVDAHNITVPTALSMIEAVLAVHQPHPSNPLRCAAEYELRPCPTEEAIMDALEGVIDGE